MVNEINPATKNGAVETLLPTATAEKEIPEVRRHLIAL